MTITNRSGFGFRTGVPRPKAAPAARVIQTSGGLGFPLWDVGSIGVDGLAALIRFGSQTKESRSVPPGAGNQDRDLGEIGVGLSVVRKPTRQHHDAVALALPLPDQNRARLDPARQHDLAVRLRGIPFHHLIEQALRRAGEAAIGLLLNPMRDTAPEEVRPERLRRVIPKHFALPAAYMNDP